MKRAAAIVGPTASFVRWAIVHECSFRQPVDKDLTYQVFRQLRSLREVSLAKCENRIVDNVCLHQEFHQSAETARGFPVDEIEMVFGDLKLAEEICFHCPANAWKTQNEQAVLAGCYGWFFSAIESVELIKEFQFAADDDESVLQKFPRSQRAWFRIWQLSRWQGDELENLADVFRLLPSAVFAQHPDLENFCRAINRCQEKELQLVTELVPAGVSDGIHWTIEPHCSNCRCEMSGAAERCNECGFHSRPIPTRKRKVLGLRPYMLLKSIFGLERVSELLDNFRNNQAAAERADTDPTGQ